MRCFILSVLFCGFYIFVNSQTDQRAYNLQNVIPPSPNAASLGKYADWPVNLYTGIPQISIPIYELSGRTLSVPISLSYHASGIKVGEHASSVGLGWSLQAGGLITRSVRGLADDDPSGYLAIRSYYNNPGDLSSGSIASGNSAFSDSSLQLSIANGNADSEPDLYMFNALGRSYKFYFAGDGTIVTQPYSNLKITFNSSAGSWLVILEDGTKLLFGGGNNFKETTYTEQTNTITDPFTSSWYLQSITSTSEEVINFTYTVTTVTFDSYLYQADYLLPGMATVNYLSHGTPEVNKYLTSKATTQTVDMLNIVSIETELGKVFFDTMATRWDMPGAVSITGIRVFSKLENLYVKKFKLYYGYSSAASSNTYTQGYSTPLYRLKLDTLEELSIDANVHKYWKFDYNTRSLPSRKSYAQDYWGYYNGATNNTTLLPYVTAFNPYVYNTANRSADSASMIAEMLTKITYPTGGYSQFSYEPNGYPANEEQFVNTGVSPSLYLTYNQSNFTNTQTTTFTTTKAQYFKYQFTSQFSSVYLQDFGNTVALTSAVLKNSEGTQVSALSFNKTENNSTKTNILYLNPGTYTFTISSISNQGDFGSTSQWVSMNASYNYLASQGYSWVNHPLGGVRIKSILDYDNIDTSKSMKRYFQYENANVAYPIDTANDYVSSTIDNLYDCSPPSITSCSLPCLATSVTYTARSSSTKFSLGSIQGGTVGYGKVTEKFGPNAENGKNVYYYSFSSDMNIASAKGLPYPPIISLDYQRGLLLEKDVYNAGNVLLKKTENTYDFLQKNSITAYKVAFKFNILSSCYSYNYLGNVLHRTFYQDLTKQVKNISSTEKNFNLSTGDSLVTTTYYYYDDALNMQPVRTVSTNSKGDSILTYIRTALEKSAINSSITLSSTASTAIDTMVARNMVGIPIESEKYVRGLLINKELTNYKVQSTGLVLPDNVMRQVAQNPIETRIQYVGYDGKGNLTQQLKAGDITHSYLYDYSRNLPTAGCSNADTSSIAATSFESDSKGNWTYSGMPTNDNSLTGIKAYNVANGSISKSGLSSTTTYIVSYWTKNISAFTITGTIVNYPISGRAVGAWKYFEHRITGQTTITINGSGLIDELRLYPVNALMTTYCYNPLTGISSQCDANNRITYYEYDGLERLALIRDQDNNIIKKICYNYAGQPENCNAYSNIQKSGNFTRNNCPAGGTPNTVMYVVAANTYFSFTSQADADAKAQNDVDNNGQIYANNNGTCTFYNIQKSGSFTRNNCPTGGTPNTVTYTVAAASYSSTVSQAAADQLAQNDVNANGQTYANNNGTCTFYNVQKSGSFTRNNCPTGGTPNTVTYTVAAGTYSSTVSQAAADQLAQNDVNGNGQTYANNNGTCTFYNVQQSWTYTRNNCPSGAVGSYVTYTVAAGTYSSTVSQAAADQLAQNDVNANGQTYANNNGTCTWYNVQKSGNFTRNNCSSGYVGSTVTYTVAAAAYSSTTSQAAADQLAQNDVNANGQAYANANGTCTQLVTITSINYMGVSGFNAVMTNTSTSQQYSFSVSSSGTQQTLGTVPAGTYNVTISKSGNSISYAISFGNYYHYGSSASFSNVAVSTSNNNQIIIDGQ